jgi:hypothetical protein
LVYRKTFRRAKGAHLLDYLSHSYGCFRIALHICRFLMALQRSSALETFGLADTKQAPVESEQVLVFNDQKVEFGRIRGTLTAASEGKLVSLALNNSTLVFSEGTQEIKLTLARLSLSNQSALITNGRPLTIEAKQILSDDSEIRSFDPESLTPPATQAAGAGV